MKKQKHNPMQGITFTDELYALAAIVREAGAELFAVGGLVRNALLGLPPSDMDICSRLTPDEITSIMEARGIAVIQKAPKLGTVELHIGGRHMEHTTFRGDSYGAGGAHRPEAVRFTHTPQEDAHRRDFTCNALYAGIESGRVYDPTGGAADVKKRLLRAVRKDARETMQDDGLRVMRLVRFACELGFTPEKKTWAAAQACAAGLADISWERKRDELNKILLSDMKYPALTADGPHPVLRGLFMLHEMGALAFVLPELLEGDGVGQRAQYHAHDVMRHNLHACAAAPATLLLRLASLLHDVGKPAALREKGLDMSAGAGTQTPAAVRERLGKGQTPMLHHDALGADIARAALVRLRYPNSLIEDAVFLIRHHMYDLSGRAKESTLRARFAEFGYERSLLLCAIREADVLGSGRCAVFSMWPWRDLLAKMKSEGAPFSESELNCTGRDIMDWLQIPPSAQVGEIKMRLLRHCACHPADNTGPRLRRIALGMKHIINEEKTIKNTNAFTGKKRLSE